MANDTDFAGLLKKSDEVFNLAFELVTSYKFYIEDLAKKATEQIALQTSDERIKCFGEPDGTIANSTLETEFNWPCERYMFDELRLTAIKSILVSQIKFCDLVKELQESIKTPPLGFEFVADQLWRAAKIARFFSADGLGNIYHDSADELGCIAKEGHFEVVLLESLIAPPAPSVFLSAPKLSNEKKYPPTFDGHLKFLKSACLRLGRIANTRKIGQYDLPIQIAEIKSDWLEAKHRADLLYPIEPGARACLKYAVHTELAEDRIELIFLMLTRAIDAIEGSSRENKIPSNEKKDTKTTTHKERRNISDAAKEINRRYGKLKRKGLKPTIEQLIREFLEESRGVNYSAESLKKQITELRKPHRKTTRKRQ